MDKILTPLILKILFWVATVMINLFAFLSWSYLQNQWTTPEFVEQRIVSFTVEEREKREELQRSINLIKTENKERDEANSKTVTQILIGLNDVQSNIRHISEGITDIKIDNREIKGRLLEIERRGN